MTKEKDNESFVRLAQEALGLTVDGWAGKKTIDALNKILQPELDIPSPPVPGRSLFDDLFKEVIGHEGGFQADPRDRGNWTSGRVGIGVNKGTKYGVSAAAYPNLDIRNLTLDDAKRIYRRDYWDKLRCDDLPPGVAYMLFDMAVNHGTHLGTQILQRGLGVADDGRIGDVTVSAAWSMPQDEVLERTAAQRAKKYLDLAARSSNYAAFLGSEKPRRGWLGRNLTVLDQALAMV